MSWYAFNIAKIIQNILKFSFIPALSKHKELSKYKDNLKNMFSLFF